ncbi:hypothetical protein PAECIP112173_03739 [Paenibacillus sp. JJ-100]|uniref:hypothetical protein n=1 Tax=Paenibacillus sp. JJ-100 TaxID=2974896 RepID=UPI0022FFA8C6|nr:hypothetical protein [Paenibacillus sp. JJ-100]CAI6082954.1 hypothetical protein PAECIP112173_03739 [Paenibacillus sp. JJ-100]
MARRKRNEWRRWQASAAATLTVAALFQYVRTSDAFDIAYASANKADSGVVVSTQTDSSRALPDEHVNRERLDSPSQQSAQKEKIKDSGTNHNHNKNNNNNSKSHKGAS